MIQFGVYDDDNEYMPRMYTTPNCVVYSASHDSDCTYSWLKELPEDAKNRLLRECPRNTKQSRTYDVIELAFGSIANLAVIPMQDYLMLSNEEGRMNTPSTAAGNWGWRLSSRYNTASLRKKILELTVRTNRQK